MLETGFFATFIATDGKSISIKNLKDTEEARPLSAMDFKSIDENLLYALIFNLISALKAMTSLKKGAPWCWTYF